jgi:crossover junction endodeoxyribonuclease RuvC
MLVLGIDPGSVNTGWALMKKEAGKIHYVASGVLQFDTDVEFLDRLFEIKQKFCQLIDQIRPDQIALESLIYVKSPTALIKLAQTRGVILSVILESHQGQIFEYSPNLVKSIAVGHGHADKESIQKFLHMMLGPREFKTHDESDAVAIALCHILNSNNSTPSKLKTKTSSKRGLKHSLAHKIG